MLHNCVHSDDRLAILTIFETFLYCDWKGIGQSWFLIFIPCISILYINYIQVNKVQVFQSYSNNVKVYSIIIVTVF